MDKFKKVEWSEVRDRLIPSSPKLVDIIDDISPGKEYPLYIARYSFGDKIVDKGRFVVPTQTGQGLMLDSLNLDSRVRDHLSYNDGTNPVSFVLKNTLEICMPLEYNTVPLLPGLVSEGSLVSLGRVLSTQPVPHQPAFLWDVTAGARSLFMLPKISKQTGFNRLRKVLNVHSEKPNGLFEHWRIFKDIADTLDEEKKWYTETLLFSKPWIDRLHDPRWAPLYQYFLETHNKAAEFWAAFPIWNLVFSLLQRELRVKPDPLSMDTVKHIISIAAGGMCGFAPAIDDTSGPVSFLQKVFADVYRTDPYLPIIMQPQAFSLYQKSRPVYYSVQFPNLIDFSPKVRENASVILELYNVIVLCKKIVSALRNSEMHLQNTPVYDVSRLVEFDFFHTENKGYRDINGTGEIFKADSSFLTGLQPWTKVLTVPESSTFLRGCVRISNQSVNEV